MTYLLLSAAALTAAWAAHRACGGEQPPPFRRYDDAGCADGRSYGATERRPR